MVPETRKKVRVLGRPDEYFVLAVDSEQQCAWLVDMRGHGYVETVPFHSLYSHGDSEDAPAWPPAAA